MPEVKYDAHYRQDPRACGEPLPAFVAHAEAVGGPGVRVLDLGCGQGRDAVVFARRGCRVLGIDVSAVGVEQLNAVARREGLDIEARVGDVREHGDLDGFGVVLLDRVLHMFGSDDERRDVLVAAMRATEPGGDVLVADEPRNRDLIRGAFVEAGWTLVEDPRNLWFARKPEAMGGEGEPSGGGGGRVIGPLGPWIDTARRPRGQVNPANDHAQHTHQVPGRLSGGRDGSELWHRVDRRGRIVRACVRPGSSRRAGAKASTSAVVADLHRAAAPRRRVTPHGAIQVSRVRWPPPA